MVRKIAKGIENSNELAYELWKTAYHEARLLAVLLFEQDKLSIEDVEDLMIVKVDERERLISTKSKMGRKI